MQEPLAFRRALTIVTLISLQPRLMRLCRTLYLYFFIKYNENYKTDPVVKFNMAYSLPIISLKKFDLDSSSISLISTSNARMLRVISTNEEISEAMKKRILMPKAI